MSSNLTAEQIQRMEENRLKALAKKNANLKNINNENKNPVPVSKPSIFNNPTAHTLDKNVIKTTSLNTKSKSSDSLPSSSNSQNSSSLIDNTHGKCEPLEEDPENRFSIVIGYNKALIDCFKTIQSRKYDPKSKGWNFSRKKYNEIMSQIKHQFNGTIKLEPLDRDIGKKIYLKFFLLNKNRFEVQSEFKPDLNEIFKTLKTREYDAVEKKWSFDLSEYDKLINLISSNLKSLVTIVPLPKVVKEIFKDKINGTTPDTSYYNSINKGHLASHIDSTITKSLYSFQVESICFAIRQEGRLLLADDMGLGKTIQALAIASYYRQEWPFIIVCPSSVKFMWKENAKRWISNSIRDVCDLDDDESVDDYIQVIENSKQKIKGTSQIVISSYDLLSKNLENILERQFNMVVADECHLLKNIKASRTRSALRVIQNAKRVLMMSGTPALSRPSELFSQIQAINPNYFNNFHEFGIRYCDAKETKFGIDYSGYSNMNELKTLLEEKLLIRREKKDVMSELPSKMRETIILNPALIELKSKTLKQASNLLECSGKGMAKHGALLSYFQETAKVKAHAVAEYALDLLETGKKFLIFAHHQHMLNALQAELVENKYDFIRIDGSTGSEQRQVMVDKFQTDEKCLCALLSITAANSGITLTAASLVCFAELFWNPGILVQAEDRVYRIGQKNAVNIQYLCAAGTADDTLWPLVKDKLDVLGKVGLTKESMSDTKQSVMESSKEDIDKLNAFKEIIEESEQKNKITNYVSMENMEVGMSEKMVKEKVSIMKSNKDDAKKNNTKLSSKASTKNKVVNDQTQIDKLLNGIDFDDFDASQKKLPNKALKTQNNSNNRILADKIPSKTIDDCDDDDLLSSIVLDELPAKKVNEKSDDFDLDDDLLNSILLTSPQSSKKSKTIEKYTIVDDSDDELLNHIDLVSPKKKAKSIFKKK